MVDRNIGDVHCAVFDFDGTLVLSNEIKHAALYATVRDVPGAGECLREIMERPSPGDRIEIFRALDRSLRDRGLCSSGDPERWIAAFTEYCEREITSAPEVPGASRMLQSLLKNGTACYLNSSTPARALGRIVAGRGWERYFRGCLGSEQSKLSNLGAIAEWENVRPAMMMMIGDGPEDLEAATAFGCRFIGVAARGSRFQRAPEILLPDLHALADRLIGAGHSAQT